MIRTHENPLAWRAGILSVLVHVVLLIILLVSFNWHSAKPMNIAQVELWDSLPVVQPQIKPMPVPEPPKPAPVPEIKPVPKPEPLPEPKAEIVLKKKPPVEVKPKEEKPKPDLAKLAREEELKRQKELEQKQLEKKLAEKDRQEKLKQLQQMLAEEDKNAQQEQHKNTTQTADKASSAASASESAKYGSLISAKIRPYVNKQLCGTGKPELIYQIALLPTGEIIGSPTRIKSSGIGACDDAVNRAILQSNPLPKPPPGMDRELELKFRPNDE